MVRTLKPQNHLPEEDDDDVAAGTDTSSHREGKNSEQKISNSRSKHSETEQRRRSKINERFQILRDLIPPNDQKRDKASLLLEVIEYIQFLQEKLQVYEGSYQQVCGQEASKLIPWRANIGPADSSANNSQIMKNGSFDENNATQPLANVQSTMEPGFGTEYAYRGADYPSGSSTTTASLNIPLQQFVFPRVRSNPPIEKLASEPHGLSVNECAVIQNEVRTCDSGSNSLSSVYSEGLLKRLTQALQTSGVDLSHANISVQLDVGERANHGSNVAVTVAEDIRKQSTRTLEVSGKDFGAAAKKLRTEDS